MSGSARANAAWLDMLVERYDNPPEPALTDEERLARVDDCVRLLAFFSSFPEGGRKVVNHPSPALVREAHALILDMRRGRESGPQKTG